MSIPIVPARPARSTSSQTTVKDNMPQVPPRPMRKLDPSPSRDMRSPLNELPNPLGMFGKKSSQNNLTAPDPPERPPIVALPSVGQEGLEYASFDQLPAEAHGVDVAEADAPEQTANVSEHMPLHAPTASVPQSTAKSRIATVTRTDSTQAAAAGIGQARPDDDVHKTPATSTSSLSRVTSKTEDMRRVPSTEPHPLRQQTSFSRSTPNLQPTTSRPGSIHEGNNEQGIPEIGMQIPLNPMAGDVQAPSPAPTQSQFASGIGFFNDGSARAHNRKRSSRQEFGPPGSYGLHSHGQEPSDQFERDWAAKNPDKAALEGVNAYGTPRPETALTSEELNRLVTQNDDVGMGADPNMIGVPTQEIAWGATEEYTSRVSPRPSPAPLTERKKRPSSGAQPAVESPLRKASFPFNDGMQSDDAVAMDDGGVIHIDPAERRTSKITGGGAVDDTLDLGPQGGNTEEKGGWFEERGEGTPILASDEILKRPGSAFMQPAVDPEAERPSDDYYDSDHGYHDSSRRNSLRVPSRPSSRPNSMHGEYHGGNLYRFISHDEDHGSGMHTPLEGIEEYEPLFPEQDEEPKSKPKAVKKRPGLEHHHFPSQDVWEDTPSSLQYHTTVETPEPPRVAKAVEPPLSKSITFETAEQEHERRAQNPNDMFSDNKTLINKPHIKALQEESRPGMQRFPSQDIWEDTPDSMRLVTTVSGPQMDETKSPPDDRPTTTAMPGGQEDDNETRATAGFTQVVRPSIPARPHRKSRLAEEIKPEVPEESQTQTRDITDTSTEKQQSPDKAKAPEIPARPKPTIPARSAKPSRGEQADGSELSKSISAEGQTSSEIVTSPPVPKAKPAVPARPAGEKIAALKSGFMNDLNNRLKLGPQGPAPKAKEAEPEVVEETPKEPLADARKGRARGPARRKPAPSPSTIAEEKPMAFSMSSPLTLWSIDESDELQVPTSSATAAEAKAEQRQLEKVLSENTGHNTAEPTLGEPMSPEKAEAIMSPPPEPVGVDDSKPEQSATSALTEEEQALEPQIKTSPVVPSGALTSADVEKKELAPAVPSEGEADEMATTTATLASEELEPITKEAETSG